MNRLDENKLKELHNNEINVNAPDKDVLWSKIESRLEPKTTIHATPARSKKTRFSPALIGSAVAATFVVFVGARLMLDKMLPASDAANSGAINSDELSNGTSAPTQDFSPDTSNSQSIKPQTTKPLSYEKLNFTSYSETAIKCTGTPYGDAYFVESDVLSHADYIVSATVSRVFPSDNGESICYELCDIDWYSEEGLGETVVIESRSPYPMRRGRQYLIPLTKGESGLHTTFDSIPQIEYTADGGLVYYNGWHSLEDSTAQALLYPADDFFYDRMRFSYSADVPALINKWVSQKQI